MLYLSTMSNQEKQQVKIYLTQEYIDKVRDYGRRKGILAATGVNAGQPHVSEIIRVFIEEMTAPPVNSSANPAASHNEE